MNVACIRSDNGTMRIIPGEKSICPCSVLSGLPDKTVNHLQPFIHPFLRIQRG
jgi:hypothetical protein